MQSEPLVLELEFVRKSSSSDPYEFQFKPQDYILRRGQGEYDEAHFPWTAELLHSLAEIRLPGRSPALVQQLGDTLRQFLSTTGWATSEALILSAVERQRSVVLTLRSAAAELYALPWELMTLQKGGQHLGELPSVLLRYEWPDVSAAPERPHRAPGGRILLGWSAAGGAIPALEHRQAIERACQQAEHSFEPEHDIVPHLSCGRLIRTLEQARKSDAPIAVLHLLCHGASIGSSFGLALHDDSSVAESVVIDAARLRQLLAPYADMIRLVVLSACDSGNGGAFGNHLGSVAQELHRARMDQVVASRYPLSVDGSIRLTETFYEQLLGGSSSVAQAFLATRRRLAQDPTQFDWAAIQLYSASDPQQARPILFCPYPGSVPFLPQHRCFMFGREQESDALADRFLKLTEQQAPRLLAVIAPSGSGKSSFLTAGALPSILSKLRSDVRVTQLCPGATPIQILERSCAEFGADRRQLLIVDQFEELFTHGAKKSERQNFCSLLWRLSTSDATQVSVLIAVRSDFLHQAEELFLEVEGHRSGSVLCGNLHGFWLTPPRENLLRDAIVAPANRVGLELDPGLLERILEELDAQPGALPLLQRTMELLWRHRDGNRLTQESFDGFAGVVGGLLTHADQVSESLTPEDAIVAQRLWLCLGSAWTTGSQPNRRRVSIRTLRSKDESQQSRFNQVLQRLIHERLLVASSSPNEQGVLESYVEVAHDALLRKWPRLLAWVDKARPMLTVRENLDRWVTDWRLHQTLLTGSQLGYAVQMAAAFPEAIDDDGRELLTHSEQVRLEEEELKLRGLDTLRLLAAKSVFGNDSSRIASALLETKSDAVTTIPGWLDASIDILHNQVLCTAEIEHGWGLWDARWHPDGQSVVLVGLDGTVQIWEPGAERLYRLGREHNSPIYRVSYSPDGEKLLTLCADGTARVWSVSSGELLIQLVGHQDAIEAGVWSRDGRLIATASDDQTARLFDAQTGKQLTVLTGPKLAVMGVSFAPDCQRLYTAYEDGSISVFSKEEKGRWSRTPLIDSETSLTALAISADGTQLATGTADARVRVYDLNNLEDPMELAGHGDQVSMVAFGPNGDHLVSSSHDRTAWLWSLRSERPPCLLRGHRLSVQSASFSRDGRQIVTACSDGRARIWDATRAGLDHPKRIKPSVPLPDGLLYRTEHLQPKRSGLHSSDGQHHVTMSSASSVQVTPAGEHGMPFLIEAGPDSITGIQFSPNGERLILTAENRILVCDLHTRSLRWLEGHTYKISCFAISPNSEWLITGAEDWTARIWSLVRVEEPRVLSGHDATPVLVLFDSQSRWALTVELDGATRIWPESGPPISLLSNSRLDHTVAITPDWKKLVTQVASDRDAPLYLWDLELDPMAVQQKLRSANKLVLSEEEYLMLYVKPQRPMPRGPRNS